MKIITYADAIQYDGTNGAAVATAVGGDFEITSDDGQTLNFTSCGNVSDGSWLSPVVVSGWVRHGAGCVHQVLTPAEFAAAWLIAPEPA